MKRMMLLCMLIVCMLFSTAQAESGTYGKTRTTLRVRASASLTSAVLDNIIPDACVYMLDTAKSGSDTFAKVQYRAYSGSVVSGWVRIQEGSAVYVDKLTDAQAKALFSVSGGSLPSARVGKFKTIGTSSSGSSSSSSGSSSAASDAVRQLQTHLKKLGYYTGEITGNIGPKTEAAIKAFQKAKGLTVTGKADSTTLAAAEKAANGSSSGTSSGSGSSATAAQIRTLQENLKKLGYYYGEITGNIGSKTEAAIKAFQKAKGLTVTGEADAATLSAAEKAAAALSSPVSEGKVYKVDWFANKAGFYKKVGITPGGQARLTDLLTGRSLNIYILYTGNHADVEPLTADDTETLCKIYGVSSPEKISYVRRPMLVTVGGFRIVGSIYGVPHGDQKITTNNFDGQFCLHFSGSKTHGTSSVDADHQAAISKAATIMENKGYTIMTKAPSL